MSEKLGNRESKYWLCVSDSWEVNKGEKRMIARGVPG